MLIVCVDPTDPLFTACVICSLFQALISRHSDAAKAPNQPLQQAYAGTNLPTAQLNSFIRLCLTDSNFPDFVEAVEKELNTLLR